MKNSQHFDVYTEHEEGLWYTYVKYPEQEGGSLEKAGPFDTEKEANEKAGLVVEILKGILGKNIKQIHWKN